MGMKEFIDAVHRPDNEGKTLADRFAESKQAFDASAEAHWNGLSYDDRLKVFYSVCKRIHKGELVDRGSYRHVLYQVFGFGVDAYSIGMDCGYLDIHNSIHTPQDLEALRLSEKDKPVFIPNGHGSTVVPLVDPEEHERIKKERDELASNADKLLVERDEARQEVCYLKSMDRCGVISPKGYAELRKWNCFQEDTK